MEDIKSKFTLEYIVQKTIAKEYNWEELSKLINITETENRDLYFTLFETEFHHIDYKESYFYKNVDLAIYLIYEISESGMDGTISRGYNLYGQYEEKFSRLNMSQGELFYLKNAILQSLNLEF